MHVYTQISDALNLVGETSFVVVTSQYRDS